MIMMTLLVADVVASAAAPSRNVLYIVYDDLRPDLSPYRPGSGMITPNIQKLADSATVFERAYCQESVCSPSRNSFSTGRRPNSTGVYNFINHFRQATCKETRNRWKLSGVTMEGGFVQARGWGSTVTGGAGQCCTSCSARKGCAGWNFVSDTMGGNCTLLSSVTGGAACAVDPHETLQSCVSGSPGAYQRWTPLPAHMRNHGFLTLGAGKYYHDGCGGLGGAPDDAEHPPGEGTPPLADRALSWSDVPVQWPNQTEYAERWGTIPCAYGNFEYLVPDDESCHEAGGPSSDYCTVPGFDEDGNPPTPLEPGQQPLADFVTYQDVTRKLRYAAANRATSGQPFFLVAGIKRPHLGWRVPPAYAELYPAPNVTLPKQRVLDASVWAGAYTVFPMSAAVGGASGADFVTSPYEPGTDAQLAALRRHYYAAVSLRAPRHTKPRPLHACAHHGASSLARR